MIIEPGDSKLITIQGRTPPHLRNSDVVLTANKYLAQHCPSTMIVTLHKGRTQLLVTNSSDKPLTFSKGRPIAFMDTTKLVNVTEELPMDCVNMTLKFNDNLCTSQTGQDNDHRNSIRHDNLTKYPHLDPCDAIVDMTEDEIIHKQIDLNDSILSQSERQEIFEILKENRNAFSLYGELSSCPDFEVDIELTNDEPFFIRPYFATEPDKITIEKELSKLVKLGILEIGHQSYTSPVLLLSKKNTHEKRVVTDFRFLNSRIQRINHPFPLLSETIKRIGNSNTKVLSVIDLKSAFHCIPLSKSAQKYTGIASYHGGKHYYYKRLAQGLNVSPAIFQAKIDEILGTIPNSRQFCIAHHDDIILFSPDKTSHKTHLTDVLTALSNNGLKVSPKKCKLFRNDVEYMGHRIIITSQGEACIQPMNDRCAAIRKLARPKTPKQVRRFVGAVNYVAGFFPNIQSILKPLHQLTRKKNKFKWTDEHETAFNRIKDLMTKPPILHMPHCTGRFTLYSDTSRTATGSYLTQIINGKEQIIGYYSKVLPEACQRYSVTELELFGLLINVTAFKHLLKGCEFNALVDHSSIVQILKSKQAPCTNRLQKLILKLSEYSFKIGYKKGTELALADFLSRAPCEGDTEIDKVVPIACCLFNESDLIDINTLNPVQPTERRVTRAYAKKMGISVPEIYPNKSQTNQATSPNTQTTQQRQVPNPPEKVNTRPQQSSNQTLRQDTPPTQAHSQNTRPALSSHDHDVTPPLTTRHLPRAPNDLTEPRLVDRPNEHRHDSSHQHREVPPELYTPPKPLTTKVNNIVAGHIPKQHELDKITDLIKRKIIRDYNLPIDMRELKTEQETSPFFKPVYDFLAHDILPSDKKAAKSVKLKAEEYILCDGILFRLFFTKDDDFKLQLAIPETLADTIISQHHDTLLSNHQGTQRTYLTIRRNYYMPNMFERINNYVKACLRCQQFKGKPDRLRPFHTRVPDSYKPFDRISLDFKTMPTSTTGFRHLMVICDEISRFVICAPLKTLDAETICEALIQKVICIFGPPSCLITDAATSLTGKLLTVLCNTLGIDRKVISVENHGSLHVERHIRTLSNFLKVNLNQFGTDWVRYISTTCYAYNSFSSPHLGNYSPYELVFGREPPNLTNLTFTPISGLSHSYEEYIEHLKKKFSQISRAMLSLQRKQQDKQNTDISNKLNKAPIYSVGQLVYLYKPSSSSLTANSRKIAAEWCGPLVIHQILDRTHYILATLKGEILRDVYNYNRLKPCFMRAANEKKNITHMQKLKEALGKGNEQSEASKQNSDKQSVKFIDENDDNVHAFESEQIMCSHVTEPVNVTNHMCSVTDNHGIAAPRPLTGDELQQQFDLITTAPVDNLMTLQRGRFKSGRLQILVSFKKPTKDKIDKDVQFWWNIEEYKDSDDLIRKMLTDRLIPVTGTPQKFMKKLYIM